MHVVRIKRSLAVSWVSCILLQAASNPGVGPSGGLLYSKSSSNEVCLLVMPIYVYKV